jgi:5-methylcytosine-specific restriction enzyme A
MSLQAALSLFLEEYPKAVERQFSGDAVAEFIRSDVPAVLRGVIGPNPRYITHGSPGQGNWARAPWAAVYDRFITESAQDGYYVVYLVREDFAGIYLSLNQGVISARKQYGSEAKPALRVRAADFLARLGPLSAGLITGEIELAASGSANLSAYYEAGSVCSVYYSRGSLPSDDVLQADLRRLVDLYFGLVSREPQLYERADAEEDETSLGDEDLRQLREHKRVERNRKLAHRAKLAHGYRCKACGFDFQERYGSIGREFIEAHHLTPLTEFKGQKLTLDPKRDFTVLCSNCHRMIHRTALVHGVEEFRATYVVRQDGKSIDPSDHPRTD